MEIYWNNENTVSALDLIETSKVAKSTNWNFHFACKKIRGTWSREMRKNHWKLGVFFFSVFDPRSSYANNTRWQSGFGALHFTSRFMWWWLSAGNMKPYHNHLFNNIISYETSTIPAELFACSSDVVERIQRSNFLISVRCRYISKINIHCREQRTACSVSCAWVLVQEAFASVQGHIERWKNCLAFPIFHTMPVPFNEVQNIYSILSCAHVK